MQVTQAEPGSDQLLDIILGSVSEGVLVLDSRGAVVALNEAFERIVDLPRNWRSDPKQLREAVAAIEAIIGDSSDAVSSELSSERIVALALRRAGGVAVYTARDVTEERRSGSRLAQSERLLRETLDSVDASIVVYDRDDRFVLANKRYFELYPHLPDDGSLVGKTFEQMIRLTIAAKAHTDQSAIDDPEGFVARRISEPRVGIEREQLHPSGRWDLLRSQKTASGSVVTIRINITEYKHLQQALAEARDALIEANHAKSRFLASVSHELRTPLNAIIGFSEILADEVFGPLGSERYRDYAAEIRNAGHHLLALIGDVLDLSKIEAGKMDLRETEIELKPLLQRQISLMKMEARERGTRVRLEMSEAVPALWADRRAVAQMVLNLLSNALKFTRGGEVAIRVTRRPTGGIDIAVQDNGVGIPAAVVGRLGQRFFQAGPEDATENRGSGLGLSIVKEIIELHGGAMIIDSQEGSGTTVVLSFPDERSLAIPA